MLDSRKWLNTNVTVHALVRGTRDRTASERLLRCLHSVGAVVATNLNVVEGDILSPGLVNDGFAPDQIGTVIHCAASTEFHESASELTVRANIDGLQNVLEFARQRRWLCSRLDGIRRRNPKRAGSGDRG